MTQVDHGLASFHLVSQALHYQGKHLPAIRSLFHYSEFNQNTKTYHTEAWSVSTLLMKQYSVLFVCLYVTKTNISSGVRNEDTSQALTEASMWCPVCHA